MSKKKPNSKNKKSARGTESNKLSNPPLPDRRALEAMMRELVPGFAEEDSEVDAAQQIMYEAFDATSPQRQMAPAQGD